MSWLEVLSTPPKAGLPRVGARLDIPSTEPFVLGRTLTGKVIVELPAPDGHPCAIEKKAGVDHLLDLALNNCACVNGRPVRGGEVVLAHRDVVEIGKGLAFRYLARAEPAARSPLLESAIADAPHDEGRWRVYADWLLDRGEGLGRRMAVGADASDDDARWLGPMARPWRDGNLELTWRHGFIRSATLRALEWEPSPDTYWCLLRLFELELCRFLEELHVDLFTTHLSSQRPPFELRARRVLETLRDAPRTLERVSLGPVLDFTWAPDLGRELSRLREERPRLATGPQGLIKRFSSMVLRGLRGEPDLPVERGEHLHRFGPEAVLLGLGEWGIAWLTRPGDERLATPFKVNGRPLRQARLLHADLVELGDGSRYTVEVS